jgi:hypothetical protein
MGAYRASWILHYSLDDFCAAPHAPDLLTFLDQGDGIVLTHTVITALKREHLRAAAQQEARADPAGDSARMSRRQGPSCLELLANEALYITVRQGGVAA